jgi:hypothetical protein
MDIKKFLDYFLKYWWVYALTCIILTICEVLIVINDIYVFQLRYIVIYALSAMLVVLFLAWIVALFKKRYSLFFLGIPASVIICGVISLPFAVLYAIGTAGEGDDFGKSHPIPNELFCYEADECISKEYVDSLDNKTWLRIHRSTPGGIYSYAYYGPSMLDGHTYLKCYEVTENIPLSEERIAIRTHNIVKDHVSFGLVGKSGSFTLYEGSFDDYYAVRVEVWFHNDTSGVDSILNQKIYKMDGWQR